MKKKIILTILFFLSLSIVSFSNAPELSEHTSGIQRYRNLIKGTFNTTLSSESGTLYYAVSTESFMPEATALNFTTNSKFLVKGSLNVLNSDSFKSFNLTTLDPSIEYYFYSVLIDVNSESSPVFSKTIPSINYVTNAIYDANDLLDLTDDTITIEFNNDFWYGSDHFGISADVGYSNACTRDYTEHALNEPDVSTINAIKHLTLGDFSNIRNIDSNTIELTIHENALSVYQNNTEWENRGDPIFARLQVYDTLTSTRFENDGGLFFMAMSYSIINTETNSNLTSISNLKFNGDIIADFTSNNFEYNLLLDYRTYQELKENPSNFITIVTTDSNSTFDIVSALNNYEYRVYYIKVTSQDGLDSSTYTLNTSPAETRLSSITINESEIAGFSIDKWTYSYEVDEHFSVTTSGATIINGSAILDIRTEGSLPGVLNIFIDVDLYGDKSTYEITYTSTNPIVDNNTNTFSSSNNSNSGEQNKTTPIEFEKSTKQLSTNLNFNINKLLEDKTKLDDLESLEKLISTLSDLTTGVKSRDEALQASTDLINLANKLSKLILEDANNKNLLKILDEIGKSISSVISKLQNSDDKLAKLKEYTSVIQVVKSSNIKSPTLDKSISNIIKETAKSLSKVTITKKTTSQGDSDKFIITGPILDKASLGAEKKLNQLKEIANSYFEDENYIKIDKEIEIDISSDDDLIEVSIDESAVKSLQESGIKAVNIKVNNTEISLPTEMLDPNDTYELIVKKLSPTSELRKDEITPTDVKLLTNNRSYVDVTLVKNGTPLENLNKPVKLNFNIDQFGIDQVNKDEEVLTIYRYNDDSGIWEPVGGIYDPLTNTISVHRIHLSKYTVMKTKKTIKDVNDEDVKSEVASLLNKGIISKNKTSMKDNITREEFVTWLGKSYGLTSSKASAPFSDLDPKSESYKFVASVYEQGIISGKSKDKFGASDYMTYQEVAVVISNTLTTLDNKKINNNLTKKLGQMGENINVSDWAKNEVALVIELGILDDSVALNASGYITREEAAAIFDKFYS